MMGIAGASDKALAPDREDRSDPDVAGGVRVGMTGVSPDRGY